MVLGIPENRSLLPTLLYPKLPKRQKLGTDAACLQGVHGLVREEVNMPKVQYKVHKQGTLSDRSTGSHGLERKSNPSGWGYFDTKVVRLEIHENSQNKNIQIAFGNRINC